MWKLRNKKGFTLIEVMCSFSIFSILFLFAVNLKVDELKMGKINDDIQNYTYYIDAVKNEIIFNDDNNDVEELCEKGKMYLSKNEISENQYEADLKKIGKTNLNTYPYITVSELNENGKMKITLKLYTDIMGKEKIFVCNFTK
ncbi:prepilin-type N-terminal cleavage/methylation domain-containing protein [Clostridium acetobutylicum]|uniref:Prepilin-type N-terminal cleavage/methylation domain-containing protein n=2 Tax=Clostridium acetobutylicum TaxID=1488 RepID=Q97HB1_CLOAB|nr:MULTISPECIES: type II secretion system protein [Clostridium]AAK80060.1 Hypothetical protein CA_C2101 [Clostridium acetobutylicum ATCC 824]ADZ21152.1 Conserved hypothetical protein [Clostridium acetobutylicum EA 2018]AEI32183.1 hypothetical protein SMB_G2134 [Clostridium acetobutylicum DSM 1731]AWV79513.1 prepilin-type cleavage/methylation domain-containing protein [Clostridium acetobutylicum]MBC2394514.1 type II secretion system protein [Clostridium acetobutylicum]